MQEASFVVEAAGVSLYGEYRGTAPGLVFLHGMGGDLHSWDSLWRELPADLPALRYDLRGFGRSGWDAELPYDHADDLLALLDARGIDCADLVGVSLGGSVALNFALRHPRRVRSLVLISPGVVAWEWSEEWRALWRRSADAARAGDLDRARELWWQHPLFASTRGSDAGPALHAAIMAYACRHWLADPHVRALPDIERLHTLQAPTLLLSGGRDMADFRLIAEVLEASVPHLQRQDFADCGHLLYLECPATCAAAMAAFWAARP